MLGYVITDKAQLRVHELATYSGYYCGLCKEIGSSYGQFLRLGLSYDMMKPPVICCICAAALLQL